MAFSKEYVQQLLSDMVPNLKHCKHLGIGYVDADIGFLSLLLPYSKNIVGNPETGVIHGGALTTLMDTACGFAAISALDDPGICPTLDLRIDYMKPATPHKAVIAEARAYHVTKNVVFARGIAFHEGEQEQPIAYCTASFMRISATKEGDK